MQFLTSRKSYLLQAIRDMNVSMLEVLVQEQAAVTESKKDTLVARFTKVFEEFKNGGDSALDVLTGFCQSSSCGNAGKTGYLLTGSKSRKYVGFIFEDTRNGFTGVSHCGCFHANEHTLDGFSEIEWEFRMEDTTGFEPPVGMLLLSNRCAQATENFFNSAHEGIADYAICQNWLRQNKSLFESFRLPPIFEEEQNRFHSYYSRMQELMEYADGETMAKEALASLPNDADADAWAVWLREYEALGKSLLLFGWTSDEYLEFGSVTLSLPQLKTVEQFKDVFDEHYWQ